MEKPGRKKAAKRQGADYPDGAAACRPVGRAPADDAVAAFAPALLAWQRLHGRHDLPWQGTRDPYRIWLSEIMLQQTQVSTVIPYYQRFLARFPDLAALAAAPLEEVMALWAGLGYYARARNLHGCAQAIVREHGGRFPDHEHALARLPGIGRSTAAAIATFAFGRRAAILDGNVKRVLCRVFAIEGFPGQAAVERELWALAERLLPENGLEAYTQGLMDLGATLCLPRRPDCSACPLAGTCRAQLQGRSEALPVARPKKALPRRALGVLLLRRDGAILLERRPPAGIWGGLWSLPEIREGESAQDAVRRLLGTSAACEPREAISHAFTHFRLDIQPWECVFGAPLPRLAEPAGHAWVAPRDRARYGLPAPIASLLARTPEH